MDKGAHFYRCDLQVHTPRDQHWQGPRHIADEDRRDYASRFIGACRDNGLDAVAITDHHDLAFASYIRDAADAELDSDGKPVEPQNRIVVFPGIELTLSVPCQALLIFDADFPREWYDQALTALAIDHSDASEATTANVKRIPHIATLAQLRDELDKQTFLRGRYIILPNVSDSGSDTLLRSGAAPKYRSMPCVGGYLDGSIDKLGEGNRNILAGKDPEYGHKRIAVFQTSDNRREDHAGLGSVSTWIKWAVPTAEALRQACLAQESRVSRLNHDCRPSQSRASRYETAVSSGHSTSTSIPSTTPLLAVAEPESRRFSSTFDGPSATNLHRATRPTTRRTTKPVDDASSRTRSSPWALPWT